MVEVEKKDEDSTWYHEGPETLKIGKAIDPTTVFNIDVFIDV